MTDLPQPTEKFVAHVVADASDDPECIDDCPGCHPGEPRSARVFYDGNADVWHENPDGTLTMQDHDPGVYENWPLAEVDHQFGPLKETPV